MDVEIYISGQKIDFENFEKLPFQVKKQFHEFLSGGGAGGTEVSNFGKSITLPGTKINNSLFEQSDELLDFIALVEGMPVISGKCKRVETKYKNDPDSHRVEILADGVSIWERLEGVLLNQLPIGAELVTEELIQQSWTENYDSGWTGIWAPVVYGKLNGDSNINVGNNRMAFLYEDFRYHIYFPAIIKAIFNDTLGYSVNSIFFEHQMFKEGVQLYTAGDKNLRVDGFPVCRATGYTIAMHIPDIMKVPVINVINGCNEFDPADSSFKAIKDDVYTISVQGSSTLDIRGIEVRRNFATIAVFLGNPVGNTKFIDGEISVALNAGDKVEFWCRPIEFGLSGTLYPISFDIRGSLLIVLGSTVELSSFLPDDSSKDFLRGLTHKFGLVWGVNETLKSVTVEPMFDYEIEGTIYPGYYRRIDSVEYGEKPKVFLLDPSSFSKEQSTPFENYLELAFKKDTQDPVLKNLYSLAEKESDISFKGCRAEMNNLSGKGNVSYNPYFHDLAVYSLAGVASTPLPCILPSGYKFGEDLSDGDDKTYEGNPKCGLVYRNATKTTVDPLGEVNLPLIAQWFAERTFEGLPDKNYSYCYADQTNLTADKIPVLNVGLGRRFYGNYFSSIRNGHKLSGEFNMSFYEAAEEDFRALRKIEIDHESWYYILLEIENFSPTKEQLTKLNFWKYCHQTGRDYSLVKFNGFNTIKSNQVCDFEAVTIYTTAVGNVDITNIKLLSGYELPLSYPYAGTTLEATRLKTDLERILTVLGLTYNSITVSLDTSSGYTKWTITFLAMDAEFYKISAKAQNVDKWFSFTKSNCI